MTFKSLSPRQSVCLSVWQHISASRKKLPLFQNGVGWGQGGSGTGKLNKDNDLTVLILQWLPAMPVFPKRGGDTNKDGYCPKVAVRALGQERAETEETEEMLCQDCDRGYQ